MAAIFFGGMSGVGLGSRPAKRLHMGNVGGSFLGYLHSGSSPALNYLKQAVGLPTLDSRLHSITKQPQPLSDLTTVHS